MKKNKNKQSSATLLPSSNTVKAAETTLPQFKKASFIHALGYGFLDALVRRQDPHFAALTLLAAKNLLDAEVMILLGHLCLTILGIQAEKSRKDLINQLLIAVRVNLEKIDFTKASLKTAKGRIDADFFYNFDNISIETSLAKITEIAFIRGIDKATSSILTILMDKKNIPQCHINTLAIFRKTITLDQLFAAPSVQLLDVYFFVIQILLLASEKLEFNNIEALKETRDQILVKKMMSFLIGIPLINVANRSQDLTLELYDVLKTMLAKFSYEENLESHKFSAFTWAQLFKKSRECISREPASGQKTKEKLEKLIEENRLSLEQ